MTSILVHPNDILRQISDPLLLDGDDEFLPTVEEMIMVMRKHPHAVGLSAIQIGVTLRLFLMIKDPAKKVPEIVINPVILDYLGKPGLKQEGCLSFPGVYEDVVRHPLVKVAYDTIEYPNTDIKHVEVTLDAFPAHIFQHEFDHLDGMLLVDHLDPRRAKTITNRMKKWKEKGYIY